MTALPSTSVVIPVLNGATTIGDTLAGLLNQVARPRETEIIVVDNGSTDATGAIVQKFPVTLLCEPKRGPSPARNRGMAAARGEVVAFLDADTLPTRHWLAEIAAPFVNPNVILVAGRILGYQPQTTAEKYYTRVFLDREQINASASPFPFAASGNMAVRRSAALAIGGWDDDFRVGQDIDLSYRLVKKFSTTVHYAPNALVLLRNRATSDALNQQAFKYGQGRAKLWMRYPKDADWNARRTLRVLGALALVCAYPFRAHVAKRMGHATAEDVALAEHHRAWAWWYWRGFYSMIRTHEWRLE